MRPLSQNQTAVAVFLCLFSLYLFTYAPTFHSSDGLAMFATAESLVRRGAWDIEQIRWMDLQQGSYGLDGLLYSRKGIGQPLLALPLTWLGLIIPGLGPATTTLLFGSIVTALSAVVLQRYLRELGYTNKTGLVVALIFGIGTLAWPYSKTFFSDPLSGLLLLTGCYTLRRYGQTGRVRYSLTAGAALGWTVATRYAEAITLPVFGLLFLAYVAARLKAAVPSAGATQRFRLLFQPGLANPASKLQLALLGFAAPIVLMGVSLLAFNVRRYGDPLSTGYLPQESFSAVWWQGILGQLISPGRGLLAFSPVLIYSLFGASPFLRRHRAEGLAALALILGHLLLYGKWFMWHGGFAWGPRFMVATLPFWAMFLAPVLERLFPSLQATSPKADEPRFRPDRPGENPQRQAGQRQEMKIARPAGTTWFGFRSAQKPQMALARFIFGLVLAVSIIFLVPGLAVDFELWQGRLLDTNLPLFAPVTFFDLRYSPLIGTWQFLRPPSLDFAWVGAGQVDLPLLVGLAGLVLLQAWNLKAGRLRPALAASLTLLVTGFLLVRVHARQPAGLEAALATANATRSGNEAIIYNDPQLAVPLAELYRGRGQVLGLALGGPPLPSDVGRRIDELTRTADMIWWLPNYLSPAESSIEQYLLATGYRLEERIFGEQRLVRFVYPRQLSRPHPIQVVFGTIRLERAVFAPTAGPGEPFLVELQWQAETPSRTDLRIFTQLLDARGNRLAGSDGQPVNWTRPTSSWRPNETIVDRHAFLIPTDPSPGQYTLITGLYDPANGQRLLTMAGQDVARLGTVVLR